MLPMLLSIEKYLVDFFVSTSVIIYTVLLGAHQELQYINRVVGRIGDISSIFNRPAVFARGY